jgi:hypothetical protein
LDGFDNVGLVKADGNMCDGRGGGPVAQLLLFALRRCASPLLIRQQHAGPLLYRDHFGNELQEFDPAKPIQRRAYEAYLRGYRVSDEGVVHGLQHGKPITIHRSGKFRYPIFSICLSGDGTRFNMRAHKFAAYCFFGFASFAEFTEVAYLSSDLLDISRRNIFLRPAALLTPDQIRRVREFYSQVKGKRAPNGTARALADELGVSLSTIMGVRARLA